jgi:uncharacterized protein (TIRG00374 family)
VVLDTDACGSLPNVKRYTGAGAAGGACPSQQRPVGGREVHTSDIGAKSRRLKSVRLVGGAATVIVTVVFTYVALKGVDFKDAWQGLKDADLWWVVPAVLLFGLATVLRGLRWRSLFAHGRRPPRRVVINAMLIGYLYNTIMPARAGEAARVVVLRQRSTAPAAEIVGTVVLERVYDVVAILLIFFVAVPWLPSVSWFGTAAVVAGVLALGIVAAVVVLAVWGDRPLLFVLRPLERFGRVSGDRLEGLIEELVHGLSGLRHHGVALEAMLWTLAAWIVSALSAWTLTLAFHMHLPVVSGVLVTVGVGLAMILPAPPASVGVFEGAVIVSLRAYHVPSTEALPYAIVLHLINIVAFVGAGALAMQHNARHPVRARTGSELPDAEAPEPPGAEASGVGVTAGSTPVGP